MVSNNEQDWQQNTDSMSTYKPNIRERRMVLQCVKYENSLNQMVGLLFWVDSRYMYSVFSTFCIHLRRMGWYFAVETD